MREYIVARCQDAQKLQAQELRSLPDCNAALQQKSCPVAT
jgi:hypothetical protein